MAPLQATYYRCGHAQLLQALCEPALLARYRQHVEDEMPRCADGELLQHLRRLLLLQARVAQQGLEEAAALDRGGIDALLTDCFAVATWHGWPIPAVADGTGPMPLEPLQRGLLGADQATEGALLFVLDDERVALCRHRTSGRTGDMSEHWRATGEH